MLSATGPDAAETSDTNQGRDEADGRIYPDAASAQRQPPLTSLLPQRALTLVALFFGGGLAIAGIELLYARLFVGLPAPFQNSLAVLDLTGRGNVASWFASLTFIIGAITSTLIYLIRGIAWTITVVTIACGNLPQCVLSWPASMRPRARTPSCNPP